MNSSRRRGLRGWALLVGVVLTVSGCSGGGSESAKTPPPTASVATAPPAPAAPAVGACHQLTLAQATEPVEESAPVPCTGPHTATTFKVGQLVPLVDGHLLAVDSAAARAQIAQICPKALPGFLGGNATAQRLSRFETVWFSPSLKQADAGADWYRCDVVALRSEGQLLPLPRKLKGVLADSKALARFGTCGNSAPDKAGFARVACALPHTWTAFDVVDLPRGAAYLDKKITGTAQQQCKDGAMARKPSSLKHTWSFEWPSRDQWSAGQRYGYCWMPA